MRVVVPDLEMIARAYLTKLEAAVRGEPGAEQAYDWMLIELLDQMVRDRSGGLMKDHLLNADERSLDFIRERIGGEADALLAIRGAGGVHPKRLIDKLKNKKPADLARFAHRRSVELATRLVGGRDAARKLREGSFRSGGEIHKWMYDRYSLKRLLENVGLREVVVRDAATSRIPEFARYELDAAGGKPRKPDSLYMEGVKPSA